MYVICTLIVVVDHLKYVTVCRCARVFDGHKPDEPRCWQLGGEVERVLWNHFHPETFLVLCSCRTLCILNLLNTHHYFANC